MGDGVKYTILGFFNLFFTTFFSTRSGSTARQAAAPSVLKIVLPCEEVPFGGLVDTLLFLGILGAKTSNFWGPR